MSERPWIVWLIRRLWCRHERRRGIYGDEIIAAGWKRGKCLDCPALFNSLPADDSRGDEE